MTRVVGAQLKQGQAVTRPALIVWVVDHEPALLRPGQIALPGQPHEALICGHEVLDLTHDTPLRAAQRSPAPPRYRSGGSRANHDVRPQRLACPLSHSAHREG